MIRVLLKKQLTEIFRSYFVNQKKNTARSKGVTALFFGLFVLVMVGVLGGMFSVLALQLCGPMSAPGVGWLYFAIFGLLGIVFGTFGSVFNTYAGLYLGKDNDLLLAMPIPVRTILTARLLGVYLMGLMYSAVVTLPAVIVYWCEASFTAATVICGLTWIVLVSVIVLILSCVLGWVVAKLSVRLKGKSYFLVLIALLFIALYYYLYYKGMALIQSITENAAIYGDRIKGSAKAVYVFGRGPEGSWVDLLLMAAVVLGCFALVCWVLSRTFLRIATASVSETKAVYKEKTVKAKTADSALLRKEFDRFTKSATYMLNCGLGILFLTAVGVFLLIKGSYLLNMMELAMASSPGFSAVMAVLLICMMSATVLVAAPSVSLEGKTLWQLQVLPVTGWQVLRAKLRIQLLLCSVPTAFASACAAVAVPGDLPVRLLVFLAPVLFSFAISLVCLFFGLKLPNFNWTSEITPIKQGGAVVLSMLGGMGLSGIMAGLYFLVFRDFGAAVYLAVSCGVYGLLSLVLLLWLRKRGAARFESL